MWLALVVFTSGIIDERRRRARRASSVLSAAAAPLWGVVVVGVEPGGAVGGWLVLARCWALRNQARKRPWGFFLGVGFVCSVPPSLPVGCVLVGGVGGWGV